MNYIIFDLEFNQKHPDNKDLASPGLTFEILQIGAIKLDANLNTVGKFNRLVKPKLFSTIHPYVEKLTSITLDMVNNSDEFIKVFNDFLEFIGDDEFTFVVWGSNDLKELFKNMAFYNIDSNAIIANYIDIQSYATSYFKCPKGNKIGLEKAISLLNIDITNEFHNALNDAVYTSKIFKNLSNKKIKIKSKKYRLPREKFHRQPNQSLDTKALFAQFEKIYKRQMSTEEKEMIRLAYMMGKTKQFIKDKDIEQRG